MANSGWCCGNCERAQVERREDIARAKVESENFDPAHRAPDGVRTVPPNRRGVAKARKRDVMHQVKGSALVQMSNELARCFVPKHAVELQTCAAAPQSLQVRLAIKVNELGDRLLVAQLGQRAIDVLTILALRQDRYIVESGHLDGPLPPYFWFGAFIGFASESRHQHSQAPVAMELPFQEFEPAGTAVNNE